MKKNSTLLVFYGLSHANKAKRTRAQNLRNMMTAIAVFFSLVIPVKLAATNYYVSNNGNDSNDGLSNATAWQSTQQVNATTLLPGDTVLFEAGGTWRYPLIVTHSGNASNNIVYTRYGAGANPQILGSEQAVDWTPTGTANVWVSATSLTNYSDEYYAGRIYFLNGTDVTWGEYQAYDASFTNLTSENDYTVSGTTYYVYSTIDPDVAYSAIEVTQQERCIIIPDLNPQSYLEFSSIDLKFSRNAGFDAGYPAIKGATNLIFRNCTIGYIGSRPSGYAYGIAAWHSNFLAENNTITDCGRRGISLNFYLTADPGEERKLENIIVRNNTFKRGYHTTSLDLSANNAVGDTVQNVFFYNNYIDDSDFGEICSTCGSNQLFVQQGNSSVFNNIYVVGNVFVEATARNILFEGSDTSYVWNNTIIGNNPNITENTYGNVIWNSNLTNTYYQNNILYDNLPDNSIQNHGVFIEGPLYSGVFEEKDYNLYHSLYPKTDRNISGHNINNTGAMGYWQSADWADYITNNTLFEQNSPSPQDPDFVDYGNMDYRLTETSAATGTGIVLPYVLVTGPEGLTDTINKYDITGYERSQISPSLGAYEYQSGSVTCNLSVTGNVSPDIDGAGVGSIDVIISGGTFPYAFQWSDASITTEDRTNLTEGTYMVTVTDDNSCIANESFTVTNEIQTNTTEVFIQDTSVLWSSYFEVPVITTDLVSDDSIISYQFTLAYDPAMIEYQSYDLTSTIASSGSAIINSDTPGTLYIGYTNAAYLSGQGAIINIGFEALQTGNTVLDISDFYYNVAAVNTVDASITVDPANYGDIDANSSVTSFDASLALQYSVLMDKFPVVPDRPWEAWRLTVAEVDGLDPISAFDASLILQYAVGSISEFPVESFLKNATQSTADVEIKVEGNKINFYSKGNLTGLNIFMKSNEALDISNAYINNQNVMQAVNNTFEHYNVGMAMTNSLDNHTLLLSVPFTLTEDKISIDMLINGQYRSEKLNLMANNLSSLTQGDYLVYPNPATSKLNFKGLKGSTGISIYNMTGEQLYQSEFSNENIEVDISHLESGLYIVKIQNAGNMYIEKITKK